MSGREKSAQGSFSGATWPLVARAQHAAMPVIGLLSAAELQADAFRLAAFREGLKETGYIEGRNVVFEHRSADDHYDRLPALAAEFVRSRVWSNCQFLATDSFRLITIHNWQSFVCPTHVERTSL